MTNGFLYPGEPNPNDGRLSDPTVLRAGGDTQHGAIVATGGVVVSGAAVIAPKVHRTIVASGGVVVSGDAVEAPKVHRSIVASGGVLVSGDAVETGSGGTQTAAIVASGGVRVGGAAVIAVHRAIVASGGGWPLRDYAKHGWRRIPASSSSVRVAGFTLRATLGQVSVTGDATAWCRGFSVRSHLGRVNVEVGPDLILQDDEEVLFLLEMVS